MSTRKVGGHIPSSRLVLALLATTSLPRPALGAEAWPRGELVEKVACLQDPTQTYTLYLPGAYTPDRKWPTVLIFDPRGRGTFTARIFRDAAEKYGWIVLSSDNTRSDVQGADPNERAIQALWAEVHLRHASDERRIYAAGFSGGAMLALRLAEATQKVAGIIASGGRIPDGRPIESVGFAHFASAGRHDFNYLGMRQVDELVDKRCRPHRFEEFEGAHEWMPAELAEQAVGWMEALAMKDGLRTRDEALLEALFRRDLARIEKERAAGDRVRELRRTRAVLQTYKGLRDFEPLRQSAVRLEKSEEFRRQQGKERDWDGFEERQRRKLGGVLGALGQSGPPPNPDHLVRDLDLDDLRQRARRPGYQGDSAQRVLELMFVNLNFYLLREAFQRKDYAQAVLLLTVALRIHGDRPGTWYNLAAARARLGNREGALDALESAIENGFRQAERAQSDSDFESIRSAERFRRLMEAIRPR